MPFRINTGETVIEYLLSADHVQKMGLRTSEPDKMEKQGIYHLDARVKGCSIGLVVPRAVYIPRYLNVDYAKVATLNTMLKLLTAGIPQSLKIV